MQHVSKGFWKKQLAFLAITLSVAAVVLVPLFFFSVFSIFSITAYSLGGAYVITTGASLMLDVFRPAPPTPVLRKVHEDSLDDSGHLSESGSGSESELGHLSANISYHSSMFTPTKSGFKRDPEMPGFGAPEIPENTLKNGRVG